MVSQTGARRTSRRLGSFMTALRGPGSIVRCAGDATCLHVCSSITRLSPGCWAPCARAIFSLSTPYLQHGIDNRRPRYFHRRDNVSLVRKRRHRVRDPVWGDSPRRPAAHERRPARVRAHRSPHPGVLPRLRTGSDSGDRRSGRALL